MTGPAGAFAVFADQDSGCLSYGIERGGRRWFVKTAQRAEAADALARVVALHRAVRHEVIVRPVAVLPGPTLVYPWCPGEVFNAATRHRADRAALGRFQRRPVGEVRRALVGILSATSPSPRPAGWPSTCTTAASCGTPPPGGCG